ncbi:MAG TPA: alpha/beta hydrolase [Sphingomonas sp.]|jgi:pimeloyl-ACP methyl ester carboxylesterase
MARMGKIFGVAAAVVPAMLAGYSGMTRRAAERAVPADGTIIDIDGAQIHYVDKGIGPAIVMIHGLGGQLRNFSYALTDYFPDRRVILVDRPGSGYSHGDSGALGVGEQAAIIAKLIGRLGLDRPLIVGHSLGGAVALALALDHGAQVGACALIAPATQPKDVPPPGLEAIAAIARMPAAVRLPFAWTVATPMATLTAKQTAAAIFAPEAAPEDFGVRGGGVLGVRPNNISAAAHDIGDLGSLLKAMAPRYPSLTIPVGILYAAGDRVLDPKLHGEKTAAAIPGAWLEMIEGGHMIPITQPERVAAFIRRVEADRA